LQKLNLYAMNKIYTIFRKNLIVLLSIAAASLNGQTSYCNSAAIVNADEEIYNVMVNGAVTNPLYSFSNGCSTQAPGPGSSLGLYSNFKTLGALTTVIQGVVTSFSIAQDECDGAFYYNNGIGVWIDFNADGDFVDPGENVYLENSTTTGPRTIAGTFTVPISATTGTTVMRVICAEGYSGSSLQPCLNSYGYGETEDYRIDIIAATPCSGVPPSNSVVGPTAAICPGATADLGLANMYTVTGISYQWQTSTFSNLGPYTSVSGATNAAITTTNINAQIYYQAIVTCVNGGGSVIASPVTISVQPVTVNTPPYYESFEGIAANNKLPNCSWNSPTIGGTAKTYISSNTLGRVPRTGTKFASFYYSPSGTNYFYSNGLQLEPGITYSASIWFQTEYYGYNNWSDLSILVGPNQSSTGLVPVASTNGPAVSNVYKSLSNTFTVASSGVYYMAIRATATSGSAQYLSWDDLAVEIPCSVNSPTLGISTTNTSVCEGQAITLTATGADTYAWSTGDNGSIISTVPLSLGMTNIVTVGTNTLTGCTSTVSQMVYVNPAPEIYVYTSKATVCEGTPVNLTAFGANSYSWSIGGNNPMITVTPASNTSYTVLGSNSFGCIGTGVITVSTNPLPNVNASSDRPTICAGETVVLTAIGATTYSWLSSAQFIHHGNPVVATPYISGTYTVTGTDANGCSSNALVTLGVDACTGILTNNAQNSLVVYPNPTSGLLTIETGDNSLKTIQLTDLTGRVVISMSTQDQKVGLNLENVSNGIYQLSVSNGTSMEVMKVVKQ
jgi:hypothetical protein